MSKKRESIRNGDDCQVFVMSVLLALVFAMQVMFWFGIEPSDFTWESTKQDHNEIVNKTIPIKVDVVREVNNESINESMVIINSTVDMILSSRYKSDKKEFGYTLNGTFDNMTGVFNVTSMEEDIILHATKSTLRRSYLDGEQRIIRIHSHPSGNCLPSKKDTYAFGNEEGDEEGLLIGIVCGQGKYGFYNNADFTKSLPYKIE